MKKLVQKQKIHRLGCWIIAGYVVLATQAYQMVESLFWRHDFWFGAAYLFTSIIWVYFIEVRVNMLNKLKFEVAH